MIGAVLALIPGGRITLAFVAVAAVLTAGLWWQTKTLVSVRADLVAAQARSEALSRTIELIRTERESDAEIDAIPDSDLRDALDPRWLRGGP